MPIEVDEEIRVFSREEFHATAERIIGVAFNIHNTLGRLMNEENYKQALRQNCETEGIVPALREVAIRAIHSDFEKHYSMDLLFARGLMVEAKTVDTLTPRHNTQVINYLLMTGMQHGLLLNFRPGQVEKQFVSTGLNLEKRRQYTVNDSEWKSVNSESHRLRRLILNFLDDWGAFLEVSLYRDAVIHFFGGRETALRRIPVFYRDTHLGTNEMCLIADDTAVAFTSLKENVAAMTNHLARLLSHTRLAYIQWINMCNHQIEFRTIASQGRRAKR